MIDASEPGSPGWWLAKCSAKLELRRPRLQRLADIVAGDAPFLRSLPGDVADSYRQFRDEARTNYALLTVQTLRRRMRVDGFRTPLTQGSGSDADAQRMWDANGMTVELADVLDNMIGLGDGYTMLGVIDDEVTITGEDPRQVVTIHDPIRQRVVRAGAKLYHDDDLDLDVAYLHLPGRVWRATRTRRARVVTPVRFSATTWDWDDDFGGEDGVETGIGRVPIVRWRNRSGVGHFEPHLDLLARLDRQTFRRDVIAAVQAFRQRAAFNTPDATPDGRDIDWDDILTANPGAFWRLPEGVELWESSATDLRPLNDSINDDLKKLAAVSSTPMTVFFPDAASGSAEGAALMREEHIAQADDIVARANEAARDTVSIGFELAGDDERSARENITVLWAPTERRSLAEMADAESKATAIPFRSRMSSIWGFSETEIDRMEAQRSGELIDRLLAEASTAAAVPVGGDS